MLCSHSEPYDFPFAVDVWVADYRVFYSVLSASHISVLTCKANLYMNVARAQLSSITIFLINYLLPITVNDGGVKMNMSRITHSTVSIPGLEVHPSSAKIIVGFQLHVCMLRQRKMKH